MPLLTTRAGASSKAYGFSAVSDELGGMVLITPTSIASTGTGNSSSIGANGSVTFSSCTGLSLNGVFSATYDNYKIILSGYGIGGNANILMRMRASGTDNSTASSYVVEVLEVDSTTVVASRVTASNWGVAGMYTAQRDGHEFSIYGPYLSQPTAVRCNSVFGYLNGYLSNTAGTHNQSTSYDGFTFYTSPNSFTGTVSVYGLKGA